MIGMSAVIFIPDDTAKTGYPQPLMLQSVMGAPLLAWLANALFDSGVGRFFLVCHDRYVEAARACLPAEAEVMTTMDSDPADLLHVFLSTAEDAEHTITVVTGPAVYLPQLAPQAAGRFPRVYGVSREELMQALDEHFSFARFLLDNGSPMNEEQAMYSVASPAELPEIAGLLQRNRLLALARTGVEIYDASSCYVEPSVRVAPGARLLPGTMLRARLVGSDRFAAASAHKAHSEEGRGSDHDKQDEHVDDVQLAEQTAVLDDFHKITSSWRKKREKSDCFFPQNIL